MPLCFGDFELDRERRPRALPWAQICGGVTEDHENRISNVGISWYGQGR